MKPHQAPTEPLGWLTLIIFVAIQLLLLLFVGLAGTINCQAVHCQTRNRGAPGNELRKWSKSLAELGMESSN